MSELTPREEYLLRTEREDKRMGGVSVEAVRPSRFRAQGAEATQSSDYRALDRIFDRLPLTEADTLLDVGCGEGRVLTYLYLRGCPARLAGVELDPDVAETARRRVEGSGIEILCADILDAPELMDRVTVYYLFNPFNGKVFTRFIGALESRVRHPVRLAYLFDYYSGYLDGRPGWTRLAGETFARPGQDDAHYSIYAYTPQF